MGTTNMKAGYDTQMDVFLLGPEFGLKEADSLTTNAASISHENAHRWLDQGIASVAGNTLGRLAPATAGHETYAYGVEAGLWILELSSDGNSGFAGLYEAGWHPNPPPLHPVTQDNYPDEYYELSEQAKVLNKVDASLKHAIDEAQEGGMSKDAAVAELSEATATVLVNAVLKGYRGDEALEALGAIASTLDTFEGPLGGAFRSQLGGAIDRAKLQARQDREPQSEIYNNIDVSWGGP